MTSRTILVLAVVVVSVVIPAAAGSPVSDQREGGDFQHSHQAGGNADVEFIIDPMVDTPNRIQVNATFSIEGTQSFNAFVDGGDERETTIHGTNGISVGRVDGGEAIRFSWDGETDQAWVNYTVERSQKYRQDRFKDRIGPFIDGGEWMYLEDPKLETHRPGSVSVELERTVETSEPVVHGNALTFIGAHEKAVRSSGSTDTRIVVPSAADLEPTPEEIAEMLAKVSAELPSEPPTDTTYVFVSGGEPQVNQAVGGDISIDDRYALTGYKTSFKGYGSAPARNTWIHEYFHTRETYPTLTDDFEWYSEASADYFMMVFSLRQGLIDNETFLRDLRGGDGGDESALMDDTLSNPSTWEDGYSTQYEKGRRVLAALDGKIRADTNGNRTLLHVYDRMTEVDTDGQRLGYTEFKNIVEQVAGESYDAWLDKYVTTGAVPPISDEATAYAVDIDGNGSFGDEPTRTPTTPDPTHTPTEASTPPSTPSETPAPTPTASAASQTTATEDSPGPTDEPATTDRETATGGSGPGFGIVAAILATLAASAFIRWRR